MAAYSIADEPAVTPNVEIQDIQQQQEQRQPPIQQPQTPSPPQMQQQPQQQQRPPQPQQQQPPPQWNQSSQQALDKLTTSEQAIQGRIFSGEYDPKEPGVQMMMGAIQKQKAPLMQQKQAAQAAAQEQEVQGAMKQAAVQASIENVHRVERAKVFEQGVGKFTDAETGATEHFYEAKPGDWKPIEWKKQQAQSDTEPAIYNQMTGQEYSQSRGFTGDAQQIGRSLGWDQGGQGQEDFQAVPLAQRDAIKREVAKMQPPPRTGNPRIDAMQNMQFQNQKAIKERQMLGEAAKSSLQKERLGETAKNIQDRLEGQMKLKTMSVAHEAAAQKLEEQHEEHWWKRRDKIGAELDKQMAANVKEDEKHKRLPNNDERDAEIEKRMAAHGLPKNYQEFLKSRKRESVAPEGTVEQPKTTDLTSQAKDFMKTGKAIWGQ